MGEFILSCCSTADLSLEYLQQRNIVFACFHYELDGKQYQDDFGKTISLKDFYHAMKTGAMTKTSQVNVQEYIDLFEKFLAEGKDILHLTLSSGISGTYNSASIAAERLRPKYPERTLAIVDSLGASSGFGLLVDRLADLRDSGMSIQEAQNWAEENRLHVQHWFASSELTYYVRGGRISKTAGFVGSVLNICPLLTVCPDGSLTVAGKIRSKKKALKELVNRMKENTLEGPEYQQSCFISHSDSIEDAETVAQYIEEEFPLLKGKIKIFDIGTTIGSHTGPGTTALFFWGKPRIFPK